jgi:AcrR family transcriptional regulator
VSQRKSSGPAQRGAAAVTGRASKSAAAKPKTDARDGAARAEPRERGSARAQPRERGAARAALVEAARAEFDEAGYEATDTNRIARRAGYAPQTFYRHFADKTAIFVETYHRWVESERKDLEKAHGKGAEEMARVMLAHHARHREFRRSLRRLTATDATVKAARAKSRLGQLEFVDEQDRASGRGRDRSARIALLFCIERLADAAADGELADLGLTREDQVAMLAAVIRKLAK